MDMQHVKHCGESCECQGVASNDERETSRLERIMGHEGLQRLANSTVMVLGLGGVGSNCVEALARGGVGRLILVDRDVVQPSNINRQAIAFQSTVGRRKVDVCKAMVRDINPDIAVDTRHMLVLSDNVSALLDSFERVDYVVDALDSVAVKLALAELADNQGFPLVSAMGIANKLYPESLRFDDVFNTVNCPLCRIMRKEARKRGIRKLDVLYSREQPVPVPVSEGASRSDRSNLGTVSYMPPIMGQMLAGWVIRRLAGMEEGGRR
ncbi:ThiF family adenylyltransferase [Adlercreutzia sp. ZJ138]|uniref:tRNA threonylcarbamoyladenosine dehydratase n=1 Tax=Adlercreutzia sp. ZJ138 TaxID=2709405 RepID=UPI001F151905|nr:tRNA threonylcarbamoyladenosine dehydratase [Adlercreutzia sp. ZJ138]